MTEYDIQSLKDKLMQLGVYPNKKLGQNFLINKNVCQKIIDVVLNQGADNFIEVGPGLGALTDLMSDQKEKLTLIELDRSFAEYWTQKNYQVIQKDALQIDWSELLKNKTVLVSNLPYQISSSLVIDRSLDKNQLSAMILMFQKEVGQRLIAKPKTADYGLLSVMAQVFWTVEFVMEVGPKDFYPAPSIASRVLLFKKKEASLENPKKFLSFVKEAFKQRRKLLVSNIGGLVEKEKSRQALVSMGFTELARPEELSPEQFVEFYKGLMKES